MITGDDACRFDILIAEIEADTSVAVCTEFKADSLVVPPGSKVDFRVEKILGVDEGSLVLAVTEVGVDRFVMTIKCFDYN